MADKLTSYVHVHTPDGTKVYGPDDEVPAEHAKLISGPAWEGGESPTGASDSLPADSVKDTEKGAALARADASRPAPQRK